MTHKTHTVDAANQPLGRLASRVAGLLIGKGKRTYAPNQDGGDEVIVTNARKIKITGNKLVQEKYIYSTKYPSGLRKISWSKMLEDKPERLVRLAVSRMLPKNKLQKERIKRLKFEN